MISKSFSLQTHLRTFEKFIELFQQLNGKEEQDTLF